MTDQPADPAVQPPPEAPVPEVDKDKPCYRLPDLLRGGKEALIDHNGALYRLKVTRLGKLILCK